MSVVSVEGFHGDPEGYLCFRGLMPMRQRPDCDKSLYLSREIIKVQSSQEFSGDTRIPCSSNSDHNAYCASQPQHVFLRCH